MRRIRIRAWQVTLISVIALVAILFVASADHSSKERRQHRAYVAKWSCAHRNLRCDEPSPEAIGRRWHRREHIYQASFVLLIGVGVVSALLPAVRRRRP
jgi:hypothetical protein